MQIHNMPKQLFLQLYKPLLKGIEVHYHVQYSNGGILKRKRCMVRCFQSTRRFNKDLIQAASQSAIIQVEQVQFTAQPLHHVVDGQAEEQGPKRVALLHFLGRLDDFFAEERGW